MQFNHGWITLNKFAAEISLFMQWAQAVTAYENVTAISTFILRLKRKPEREIA